MTDKHNSASFHNVVISYSFKVILKALIYMHYNICLLYSTHAHHHLSKYSRIINSEYN